MAENAKLDIQFSNRFMKNLLANIVYFILSVIVGFFLVPFYVDYLGAATYALIPLATSLTAYLNLAVSCLNIAVSRYLTIDIHSGNIEHANITFNSAIWGTLLIVLFLLPIVAVISLASPYIFSAGDTAHWELISFFALILTSALITTWSGNFLTTLTAYNRFDYKNYVNITYLSVQLLLTLGFLFVFGPSVVYVGLAYFIASVVGMILSYYFSRKTASVLKLSPRMTSLKRLKEVGSLAVWEGVNSLSWYLVAGVALILVNILFGAEAQTRYSFVTTWFSFVMSLAALLIPLFVPMIYNYYSRKDIDGMVSFSALATKCMGIFFSLPIALLCVFSPLIMTLWVGAEYADLAPLVWIVISPLMIKVQQSCLTAITTAYCKIHFKALIGVGLGILNIILACTLPFVFDLGVYGVAIAGAITLLLMTGVVEPVYDAYLVKKSPWVFLKPMVVSTICFLILSIVGSTLSQIFNVQSIVSVIIISLIISVIYLTISIKFLFTSGEKSVVISCLPGFVKKIIPKWLL